MRAKLAIPCLMAVLVCVIVLLETHPGASQPPRKDFDPGKMFDQWYASKGYVEIKTMMKGRKEAELFAEKNGIKDGKLTRDQFIKYFEQRNELMKETGNEGYGKGPRKGPDGGKGPDRKGPDSGKGPDAGKGPDREQPKKVFTEDDMDKKAEEYFTKLDGNGDGYLNAEEIEKHYSKRFKEDWKKWDENKDSLISLSEYKLYSRDAFKQWASEREKREENRSSDKDKDKSGGQKTVIELDEEEPPPPPIRAGGEYPKEVPSWFKEYDKNEDGQVSLYEWRLGKADREMDLFERMDRNDDGFLTIDEVLHYNRLTAAQQAATSKRNTTGQVQVIGGVERPNQPGASTNPNGKGKGKDKKGKGEKGKGG